MGFRFMWKMASWGTLPSVERAHEFDPDDERLVDCEQKGLAPVTEAPMSHKLKTFLSGLIRGKIPSNKIIFSGPWIFVQNVIEVFSEMKGQSWSTKALISLAYHDNKARFVFRGDPSDPRADFLNQPMFPIYVRAAQGHSKDLELDDSDIGKH